MSDEELLYLYLIAQNQWAFNFLYQKYQNIILVLTRKTFRKFFSVPLELSDLESVTYLIFYQSVFNFQVKKNKSFKNFLLTNLNWGILKYLKKYLNKNHQILNTALTDQDYFFNRNLSFQNHFIQDDYSNLINDSNLKLSFYEQNVLQLKYQGYSNQEIMAKLNLTYKQIDNAFQRATWKLKNLNRI
ncbi:hypothetical protein [Spiroplasma platyhelix]|uniref:RNA polymerase sigma factor SigS n=1 Tax=Spiroplasma platyhelix PALS-1 TaxID=1276218 RepID=A0A846U1X5_9MOLU|nr:hypothetical protein [Spiroplasma platyhelix]MBE4704138.1 hypothetical protein [Spiroplasma platyhelix PALS-1]NKE38509.1 hypothetical protein [Spiroplasma platyhelix PALS-1]UJB29396.1 hypothetical protein SPLAT_v1c06320 [Spiroplasma platyhelix PALS-1]